MTVGGRVGLSTVSQLQERFRIVAKLGSGGMADVFLGVQVGEEAFQQLVVVKRIHSLWLENQNAMQMFIAEARTVASLSHPHVVKIFDLCRLKKDICIVMEYVDGETLDLLRKMLSKSAERIPLPVVCKWMVEACDALHYAHSAATPDGRPLKLIHRDIGPHNLMTDRHGYLKVIDFGIAKSTARSDLTTPGMIKGKFSYLAPDLFQHENIDGRADLYALGLVFHELLTLKRCFSFKKDVAVAEVLKRVTGETIPPPSALVPELPPALDPVVGRALAKDREQRYQNGEEMAGAIRAFAEAHGGLASSAEVEKWLGEVLGERVAKRRDFEARALDKARGAARPLDGADSLQTAAGMRTDNLSPVTGTSAQLGGTGLTGTAVPQRRANPYLLLVLGFLLFAGAALLIHQLFFKGPPAAPEAALDGDPRPEAAAADNGPAAAGPRLADAAPSVAPAGPAAGAAPEPEPGPEAGPEAGAAPEPTAKKKPKPSPKPKPRTRPKPKPKPTPKPKPKPKPEPEPRPKPKPEPEPEPAPAVARVSLYSGDGSWSGAQVARRGCTRCHDGGKAPELRWGQKTARQWKYFIRRKRHARHAELEQRFSKGELKRLLAHILKRLEEDEKSGIAGVK